MNVNTTSDLMQAAADALTARDTEALENLQNVARGWMQAEEESSAQLAMLEAMLEAAYLLEEEN